MSTISYTLRWYQTNINNSVTNFLNDNTQRRGQVRSPTGSGKTVCFIDSIFQLLEKAKSSGQKLNIGVVHPRIALSQEQLIRFQKSTGNNFHYTSFHSGQHVNGEETIRGKSTTDRNELDRIINNVPNSHITFSSYDSLFKLADIEFDVLICDEAHNLTAPNMGGVLRSLSAKKILFYTATPVVDEEDESGNTVSQRGMNNVSLFGNVIAEVVPRDLFAQGYIVPPLIHLLKATTDQVGEDVDPVVLLAEAFNAQWQELKVHGMPYSQMLVASRGIEDHRIIKDQANLLRLWMLIGCQVPVYTFSSEGDVHDRNGLPFLGSRAEVLSHIKNSNEHAIVVHYDTLSEGIDISSLTGICLLRMLSKNKLIQTMGRAGRPFKDDIVGGEVIDINNRKKPICVVTVPIVDGNHISGSNVQPICEAFISGGYGDISTYLSDEERKTLSTRENLFDLGQDESTDNDVLSHIESFTIEREHSKLTEMGFVF